MLVTPHSDIYHTHLFNVNKNKEKTKKKRERNTSQISLGARRPYAGCVTLKREDQETALAWKRQRAASEHCHLFRLYENSLLRWTHCNMHWRRQWRRIHILCPTNNDGPLFGVALVQCALLINAPLNKQTKANIEKYYNFKNAEWMADYYCWMLILCFCLVLRSHCGFGMCNGKFHQLWFIFRGFFPFFFIQPRFECATTT